MAKGDFYLLVQIRLLTRCKILDVVSFLHCLQIILSLKSPIPTFITLKTSYGFPQLTDLWITSLLFELNYKFTVLTGAALLALAKSIY